MSALASMHKLRTLNLMRCTAITGFHHLSGEQLHLRLWSRTFHITLTYISLGHDMLVTMLHCKQAAAQPGACLSIHSCPACHATHSQLLSLRMTVSGRPSSMR